MGKIALLEPEVIDQIAAGEVIERPASVVKELVENAIDAGANRITVEIKQAGLKEIRVIDNGCGMTPDDARLAVARHATSKIRGIADLGRLGTLGFRGEALPAIASVSHFTLVTRTSAAQEGIRLVINGGELQEASPAGAPPGTQVTATDLFYNTQPRLKFLKSHRTEAGVISDLISRFALGYPEIAFQLYSGKRLTIASEGRGDLRAVAAHLYGKEVAAKLIPISYQEEGVSLKGLISLPSCWRASRFYQTIFVNKRLIKNTQLSHSLENAYWGFLTKGQYPFSILYLELDPQTIDVNAHPTKSDIRFDNPQLVQRVVYHGVRSELERRQGSFTMIGNKVTTKLDQVEDKTLSDKAPGEIEAPLNPEQSTGKREGGIPPGYPFNGDGKVSWTPYNHPDRGFNVRRRGGSCSTTGAADQEQATTGVQEAASERLVSTVRRVDENGEIIEDPLTRPPFSQMRVVGQILNTYIVAEAGNCAYLIDQHAAHERVKYEETKEAVMKRSLVRQQVADLVKLTLTPEEEGLLRDYNQEITGFGLTLEPFGDNSYRLLTVPAGVKGDPVVLLRELLDLLRETRDNNRNIFSFYARAAYSFACKNAVKAGDHLSREEMVKLLQQLDHCRQPNHCPHGRPTFVRLPENELAARFYR